MPAAMMIELPLERVHVLGGEEDEEEGDREERAQGALEDGRVEGVRRVARDLARCVVQEVHG